MKLKPITLACLAVTAVAGCGGGGGSDTSGQTATTAGQIKAAYPASLHRCQPELAVRRR